MQMGRAPCSIFKAWFFIFRKFFQSAISSHCMAKVRLTGDRPPRRPLHHDLPRLRRGHSLHIHRDSLPLPSLHGQNRASILPQEFLKSTPRGRGRGNQAHHSRAWAGR